MYLIQIRLIAGGPTEDERGLYIIYFRSEYWQSSSDNGTFQIPEMKKFKIMLLQHRIFLFDQKDDIEVFQRCQHRVETSVNSREPLLAYLIADNSISIPRLHSWNLILYLLGVISYWILIWNKTNEMILVPVCFIALVCVVCIVSIKCKQCLTIFQSLFPGGIPKNLSG